MALIQDVSPDPNTEPVYKKTTRVAVEQLKQIHQATRLTPQSIDAVKKTVSHTGGGRYQNFRPHPLLSRSIDGVQPQPKRPVSQSVQPVRAPARPAAPPSQDLRRTSVPSFGAGQGIHGQADVVPVKRPLGGRPVVSQQPVARSIDGLTPQNLASRPERTHQAAPVQPAAERAAAERRPIAENVPQARTKMQKLRYRLFEFVQYPLIGGAALASAYMPNVGQIIIGVYFLVAVIFKVPSKTTFALALLLLACIPLFFLIRQTSVSENVAVYAYEMMAVGAAQALGELWKYNRSHKSTT